MMNVRGFGFGIFFIILIIVIALLGVLLGWLGTVHPYVFLIILFLVIPIIMGLVRALTKRKS